MSDLAAQRRWTGRLDLDVTNRRGRAPEIIEADLGRDTLTLRAKDREIAVMVRDHLVGWLAKPEGPLRCDDAVWQWEQRRRRMCLSIAIPGTEKRDCLLTSDSLCALVQALTRLA